MAQTHPEVKVILGTGNVGCRSDPLVKRFYSVSATQNCLDLFRSYGFTHIDTARLYSPNVPGTCEPLLGQTDVKYWATIDSKVYAAPTLHRDRILTEIDTSLSLLGIPSTHVYYLHGPDRNIAFEEQCCAMNDAHQAGKFKRFGISNIAPSEVEQIVHICKRNGWILPSVYQGHYNAVSRVAEETLFPVLRKHNMSFYAYSPAAGGLFSGTRASEPLTKKQGGRWMEEVCSFANI